MKNRIVGIDVARAIAVMGMIIVNFSIVIGKEGNTFLMSVEGLFQGKAAATFVLLAGVGIAFMHSSIIQKNGISKVKNGLFKRAIFLLVIGLIYTPIWPADILHFYGVYMLLLLLVIKLKPTHILLLAIAIIFLYPLLMFLFNYDIGWNYETMNYVNFWSFEGFFRNLFYNGFHPVFPWVSFLLIGFWFGKQDLKNMKFIQKSAIISLLLFVITLLFSEGIISLLSEGNDSLKSKFVQILGTSPMPPLPLYMISGSSIAIFIVSICILWGEKTKNSFIIKALSKTGKLALTFYVSHVIIGMGIIYFLYPDKVGNLGIEFSLTYALIFIFGCIIFASFWLNRREIGPLEWIMRKLTN